MSTPMVRLALALFLLAATAACDIQTADGGFDLTIASARAQDTWTRSYPLAPGGRLELINTSGRIVAEPTSGDRLELVGERTGKATSEEAARELLAKTEMREEPGDTRVRVEVRSPRTFGLANVEVRWTVKVPRGVTVDLRNTNGGIELTGLEGEVRAKTVNGGITGQGLAARTLEASTVNGGVKIELTAPLTGDGEVALEAVNGGVSLALPGASKASVTARVVNGGITTEGLEVQEVGERTRRRLEGTLNGGGTRVTLETTNGGVKLTKSTT